jgi:hypothetical protein
MTPNQLRRVFVAIATIMCIATTAEAEGPGTFFVLTNPITGLDVATLDISALNAHESDMVLMTALNPPPDMVYWNYITITDNYDGQLNGYYGLGWGVEIDIPGGMFYYSNANGDWHYYEIRPAQ